MIGIPLMGLGQAFQQQMNPGVNTGSNSPIGSGPTSNQPAVPFAQSGLTLPNLPTAPVISAPTPSDGVNTGSNPVIGKASDAPTPAATPLASSGMGIPSPNGPDGKYIPYDQSGKPQADLVQYADRMLGYPNIDFDQLSSTLGTAKAGAVKVSLNQAPPSEDNSSPQVPASSTATSTAPVAPKLADITSNKTGGSGTLKDPYTSSVAVHPEDLGDMDGVDDNGVSNGSNLFRSGGKYWVAPISGTSSNGQYGQTATVPGTPLNKVVKSAAPVTPVAAGGRKWGTK